MVVAGCPHDGPARTLLRIALDDVGLAHVDYRTTVVDTEKLAAHRGFTGSPTIMINGSDPFASARGQPGLACRLYETPAGLAGVPDLRALRQVLKRAAAEDLYRARP